MIWWLVDHANFIYVLLIIVGLVFALLYRQTRRSSHLIALGVVISIAGLVWLLTYFIITDRKQLEINLRAMADAAIAHHVEKLPSLLSPDFEFQGMKVDAVAKRIVDTAKGARVNNYHIWKFNVDEIDRERRSAKVTFRLRVDSADGQSHMLLCRGSFVRTNERWLLRTFAVFNPIANTDQPIQVPFR